jgi:hypothetical protein
MKYTGVHESDFTARGWAHRPPEGDIGRAGQHHPRLALARAPDIIVGVPASTKDLAMGGRVIKCPPPSARAQSQL